LSNQSKGQVLPVNKLVIILLILIVLLSGCSPAMPPAEATATQEVAAAPVETAVPTAVPTTTPSPAPTSTEEPLPSETAAVIAPAVTFEEVMAYEIRGCFDFFWERANTIAGSPGYGLIRDRYPGSDGIASIASVGFGLTAYLIGVEKGYITYEEAYERVDGTLDTLLDMERVEGFYFHFVDMSTGKRAWNSEVSNIDTAILLMGVLSAGEYFGGEIEEKALEIYDGVNWPWFIDENRSMFHMAYYPEKGFEGHWDFYAEQLMIYILGAGSRTYPIDDRTYYGFTRHYARFGEGEPFIHSWFGSIFTYQFTHAWVDFRGYKDKKDVDWYQNSLDASLAHYNFAVAMERKYKTLGPNAWGLTASDGPDGYNGLYGAPPSGYDNRSHYIDDTIAPAGAIGSIIFLPEQAKQAMLNYYSIEQLQGPYGFKDAYNLDRDWFASGVIGIDKGISLLMLANYENDLVYRITMENEAIRNGLARLHITETSP
jgi:hypothetical protein